MATNKKTISIYADDDLLAALEAFKDSGNPKHKSLNVAIVAILREKLFGEVSGNVQSALQSNVPSTLDIESIVNSAVESRLEDVLNQVRDLELKVHSQETYSLLYTSLKADVDNRFDETNKAIATLTSEATAPANFTQALLQKAKAVAPLKLMEVVKAS